MVQMTSTNRHAGNIQSAREIAELAFKSGFDLIAFPEAAGMMNCDKRSALERAVEESEDPFIAACREISAKSGVWTHIGSTPIRLNDRLLNRTVLIDSAGMIRARYDKIHLFDIHLADRRPTLESKRYAPGRDAVVVDTPWGPWGLSICYDLRFPQLYRDYAKRGARMIFVPSAFTVPTGRAHWETLIRARAIENGCWFVAAAQVGQHDDGRTTFGHSIIVDPWGSVVADLGEHGPGYKTLNLDLAKVESARNQIPSLQNERSYRLVHIEEPVM